MKTISFNESDFVIQWFSGTGKGGQHRNKHQNCCRVRHKASGVTANGTASRSREANKRDAIAVCRARVADSLATDPERYRATSERVRTYHAVDNRVIDHASGLSLSYKEVMEKDGLSKMIESRRKAKIER